MKKVHTLFDEGDNNFLSIEKMVKVEGGEAKELRELLLPSEIGTWSPTLAGETTAGTFTADYSMGTYYKVGRLVFCSFKISAGKVTGGIGALTLRGLPIAPNTTTNGSFAHGYATYPELSLLINTGTPAQIRFMTTTMSTRDTATYANTAKNYIGIINYISLA